MKLDMKPERLRRLRRLALTGAFGLVVFLISFMLSFPYDRLKEQIIAMAAAQNLDVEVGSAGPAFGIGVSLKDVNVRGRAEAGKRPPHMRIEEATINVSPLAQLRGDVGYSMSLDALGGEIDADVEASKTKGAMKIRTAKVSMAELPGVKEAINLPLGGKLDLALELAMPNNRNAEAGGSLSWKCAACVLGDGKEKLKVAGNPMLEEGISLPRIRLGDFTGKVTFEKGVGRLQGVQAKSADGEVHIEGEVRLADPVGYSYLDLYVRFKFSDALLKSSDKLQLMMQLVGDGGKRADGFFGFRLTGIMNRPGPIQWMKTSPFNTPGATPGTRAAAPRPTGMGAPAARGAPPPPPPADDSPTVVDPLKNPQANLPRYQATPPKEPAEETAAE
jgi:type II secretion system protein N